MLAETTGDLHWALSVSALFHFPNAIIDEDTNQSLFDATSKGPSALSNIV